MRPPHSFVIGPLAALLLAGCGGEDDGPASGTTPPGPAAGSAAATAPAARPPTGPTGAVSGPDTLRDCMRATRETARGLRLVGRTERAATDAVGREGLTLRVTRRDGEGLVTTKDLRCTRVNVAVEGDRIIRVLKVG